MEKGDPDRLGSGSETRRRRSSEASVADGGTCVGPARVGAGESSRVLVLYLAMGPRAVGGGGDRLPVDGPAIRTVFVIGAERPDDRPYA